MASSGLAVPEEATRKAPAKAPLFAHGSAPRPCLWERYAFRLLSPPALLQAPPSPVATHPIPPARARTEAGNGELGASLPPPPPRRRPRRRRGGLGGAPARHPHFAPVPPGAGAGNRQRQQRQERHGVPSQRDVPPRQAPLRRRAHGLRVPALRRSGRTRRRVRPRALLRVRHAVPVPRVPGRRGQEARRRLRRPRPARRRLDGRLLRVLRRREPLLAQLRRLPRARHLRRRRAHHKHLLRAAEPRRPGLAHGAGGGHQRGDAGGRGLDGRGERLQQEQHGARSGAVRAGPHAGGVRLVRPVLGAGGGDLRVVLVPPVVGAGGGHLLLGPRRVARRRGGRRRRLRLLPALRRRRRHRHCAGAGAPAQKAREVHERSPLLDRGVRDGRRRAGRGTFLRAD
ncbi:hypothetical protein CFC21_022236 [Triticum aestivum]|uniref:Uncharacterized protein n=2 Tax=Triticum aestivum TaxID=4565 RepID=A0A9R1EBF2_WHEAT|nr:hypothetical protein CFC21_022236 [Triticum aestivum]